MVSSCRRTVKTCANGTSTLQVATARLWADGVAVVMTKGIPHLGSMSDNKATSGSLT